MDSALNQNSRSLGAVLEAAKGEGGLSLETLLHVVNETCRELDRVHSARDPETYRPLGRIHGSLSTSTILVGRDGRVTLSDWNPNRVGDLKHDLHALAVILFECLTGKALEPGKPPPGLTALNSKVSPELERVVMKALSTASALRYPDAGTFQRGLQRVLQESFPDFAPQKLAEAMERWFSWSPVVPEEPKPLPPPATIPTPPLTSPAPAAVPVPNPVPAPAPAPASRSSLLLWLAGGIGIVFLGLLLFSRTARAESRRVAIVLEVAGQAHFTSSEADKVASADYGKKYSTSVDTSVHLGAVVMDFLYLGLAYDYWLANRRFTVAGVETRDTLFYQAAGAEVGLQHTSNPRLTWALTVSSFYPLQSEVSSFSGDVQRSFQGSKLVSHQGRVSLGFRLNRRLSLRLHGGYRLANLKSLEDAGTPYLSGGTDHDLSGPFAGLGLALHF